MSKQSDIVKVSQGAAGDPLYLDTADNLVGVRTSLPSEALHVSGKLLLNNGTDSYFDAAGANGLVITNTDAVRFEIGTERMRIDSAGRVTTPYQPAFRASFNVSSPTPYTSGSRVLNFTVVGHNIGGHYDGTNKFTAPVAGLYRFSCDRSLNTYGINRVIRHPSMSFVVNGTANHSVNTAVSVTDAVSATSYTHFVVNMGTELYLNANDYVQVVFNYDNTPSTLYEYALNYFSGYLIG